MSRILIVEDDPIVRDVASASLQRFGHELMVAESAAEARQVLSALPADHELCMLIDVVLENESGIKLAHDVIASGRPVHVLLISGFADDVLLADPFVSVRVSFLRKPFTPGELVAAVDAVCPL